MSLDTYSFIADGQPYVYVPGRHISSLNRAKNDLTAPDIEVGSRKRHSI